MFANIETERIRKAMSKKDLSARLSVTPKTLGAWISGERGIPASKLMDMTILFGCSADYLLRERRS